MSLQIIPIPLKNDVQPKDDLTDQLLSSSKTSLENGLEKTGDWYKNNKDLLASTFEKFN